MGLLHQNLHVLRHTVPFPARQTNSQGNCATTFLKSSRTVLNRHPGSKALSSCTAHPDGQLLQSQQGRGNPSWHWRRSPDLHLTRRDASGPAFKKHLSGIDLPEGCQTLDLLADSTKAVLGPVRGGLSSGLLGVAISSIFNLQSANQKGMPITELLSLPHSLPLSLSLTLSGSRALSPVSPSLGRRLHRRMGPSRCIVTLPSTHRQTSQLRGVSGALPKRKATLSRM